MAGRKCLGMSVGEAAENVIVLLYPAHFTLPLVCVVLDLMCWFVPSATQVLISIKTMIRMCMCMSVCVCISLG